jgi:hypothetical protein
VEMGLQLAGIPIRKAGVAAALDSLMPAGAAGNPARVKMA